MFAPLQKRKAFALVRVLRWKQTNKIVALQGERIFIKNSRKQVALKLRRRAKQLCGSKSLLVDTPESTPKFSSENMAGKVLALNLHFELADAGDDGYVVNGQET